MRKELGFMDGKKLRNGLELHDDGFLDEQIDSITNFQLDILIHNRHVDLGPNMETASTELVRQTRLIGALQ